MKTHATTGSAELDEAELLHLALHAMGNDRHEESMRLLKRTLQAFPGSAQARYLLGAEHAQIGLYDRAVADMTEAVKLDPNLAVAHFQLGLLHLTAGRIHEAEAAWLPLDRLTPDDPLRLFKSAMLHLVRDEFAACIENLRAGIARNKLNKPLNDDMRRLLADVEKRQSGPRAAAADAPPPRIPPPTKHMLLSTYDRNRDDSTTD
jgi:tetratricopeptide (TPR) repeat protein